MSDELLVNGSDWSSRRKSAHAEAGEAKAPGHSILTVFKGNRSWLKIHAVTRRPLMDSNHRPIVLQAVALSVTEQMTLPDRADGDQGPTIG
ncbi:hypothetical protein [Synechococcus sp. UW179A]|uniref:hypothetical protein n=1 Tax=Synechococcus sp. UW179A TaxID=2575510 RepID=UPI0010BEC53E|nr:hypothetical protein [Synechococcus sp. UW179A]